MKISTVEDVFNTLYMLSEEMNKITYVSSEINDYFLQSIDSEEDKINILLEFENNKILCDILNDYIQLVKKYLLDILKCEKSILVGKK